MRQGFVLSKAIALTAVTLTLMLGFQNCAPQNQFAELNEDVPSTGTKLPAGVDHDPLKSDLDPVGGRPAVTDVICSNNSLFCDKIDDPIRPIIKDELIFGKMYSLESVMVASQVFGQEPTVTKYSSNAFNLQFAVRKEQKPGTASAALSPPILGSNLILQRIVFSGVEACGPAYVGDGEMTRLGILPVASGQIALRVTDTATPVPTVCDFKFSAADDRLRANAGYKELLESARAYAIKGDRLYIHTNVVGVTAVFRLVSKVDDPVPAIDLEGAWVATQITFSDGCARIEAGGATSDHFGVSCTMALVEIPLKYKNQILFRSGKISGNGPCNSFSGNYVYALAEKMPAEQLLRIDNLVSTKRACADNDANSEELRLFSALKNARKVEKLAAHAYEIVTSGGARLRIKRVEKSIGF